MVRLQPRVLRAWTEIQPEVVSVVAVVVRQLPHRRLVRLVVKVVLAVAVAVAVASV
jgi:hypothetical protein